MEQDQLLAGLGGLRSFYRSGSTRSYSFRLAQLKKLKNLLLDHETEIYEALHQDLHKSKEESWVTELGFVISEINATIKHLHHWMQPQKVGTNLMNLPSSSYIMAEPLGVVLVIGPWNYPLQLLLTPLVGAIAAGNTVVLKPSEFAVATSHVIKKIIAKFPPEYILFVEGDGASVVPDMMKHFRFDHVFYTGSTAVGQLVYKMAADKLVPVTLELGGKSPCIIESDADIEVAARRIALTKFSNAGQMCVAPDYLLVHESVKPAFLSRIKSAIDKFFGTDPQQSYNYGRIINARQFDRLAGYLQQGNIVHGGKYERENLFVGPTIIENVSPDAPLMRDEVFGPIIPLFSFRTETEALDIISNKPDPLAFYVFTGSSEKADRWLQLVPSGGACVNNASWHLTNHNLPFGGRGNSGIGRYHGRFSFEAFSHKKAVLKTPTWFDPSVKYPPFRGKLGLFKKFIG